MSRPGGRGSVASAAGLRKVGAPQGRVLANGQSGRPAGKCHREQTADGQPGDRAAQVRVKRCGKSAPAPGVTRAARQTPLGARPSVGRAARPMSPGRPHRWMATQALRRWTEPRLQAGSPSLPGQAFSKCPLTWEFVFRALSSSCRSFRPFADFSRTGRGLLRGQPVDKSS